VVLQRDISDSSREVCPAFSHDADQFINTNVEEISDIVTAGCSHPKKGR
jgi:hypothetical protein